MTIEYSIGTTVANMVQLDVLGVVWPRHDFVKYSEVALLGDGTAIGLGSPKALWMWDFILREQWDLLRTYFRELSSTVYIRTKNDEDEWTTYRGIMIWPPNLQWSSTKGLSFALEFHQLIEIQSGVTGVTLGNVTLFATATVEVGGVLSANLADTTIVATGTVITESRGTLDAALDVVTIDATGTVA